MFPLSRDAFDGVLFDLDGVVTDTVAAHFVAWKRLFDDFLRRQGKPFRPFEEEDYRRHVDGRPRYEGVGTFLESRRIFLPPGAPDDPPEMETVCGLGNRKNEIFNNFLKDSGVRVYEETISLIKDLRREGFRIGLVSSSRNARAVIEAAAIAELFDTRLDGADAAELGLAGKPAPDTYLEAARRLAVAPNRAVVVEDAVAGVKAAKAGRFGLIVGVDRDGDGAALRFAGADVVVADLGELRQS